MSPSGQIRAHELPTRRAAWRYCAIHCSTRVRHSPSRNATRFGLRGFLPAHVSSMQAQVERVMANLRELPSDLAESVALNELHDRNEALFFRVVVRLHR